MAALAAIAATPTRQLTAAVSFSSLALLAEARELVPDVELDEYTAARLCASEHGRGSPAELACVVDSEVGRAARRHQSLTAVLTGGTGTYGPQGGDRPASTRQHPNLRHLAAARAVLSGELRGIARGATRFFNPKQQDRMHRRWKAGLTSTVHSCSALGVLRAWCFDLPPCRKGRRCCDDGSPPIGNPGTETMAWVGPVDGVDPFRLLLLRPEPAGPELERAFEAAAAVVRQGVEAWALAPKGG